MANKRGMIRGLPRGIEDDNWLKVNCAPAPFVPPSVHPINNALFRY